MRVSLIGSGNMATFLGRKLLLNGHSIVQVYSRQMLHAAQLANLLFAEPIDSLEYINTSADIYIIAVKDDAIAKISTEIFLPEKLVIHTSGGVSKEELSSISNYYGVFWPLKMVRKTTEITTDLVSVIDGNGSNTLQIIKEVFAPLSTQLITADDTQRLKMHLLASFTANFSNHLYKLAADFCNQEQIPFTIFYPIIETTAIAIQKNEPFTLQAGPAFRGDKLTIQQHIDLLKTYPSMKELYQVISNNIFTTYHNSTTNSI